MLGGFAMNITIQDSELHELLKELDKGIDDIESNRVTPHEETMKLLMQQYSDYVSQNP